MSGRDDESSGSANGPDGRARGEGEAKVTPLGDGAGVHIRRDSSAPDPVEIDFGGFLISLGTSCLVNLGRHADPESGEFHVDLAGARQVIHILSMLREKTEGNLTEEEEHLLKSLLYDLRMAYVEATR